ncbi:hypothetical protein Tsubulata_038544 [Turnera subulata]|uniref:F-box associated beta-propeller type 1 domain-containing protein n=1 Tax=Turnera subulata TaxID=218843 RepID=A0A9Q0F5I1_9ROSI|nr:hypothetical protein Tsubulata_038544 [Turnera subulata]
MQVVQKTTTNDRHQRQPQMAAGRFCEDLVADILCYMPVKSVVRFRCLNKYYDDMILSDPRFGTKHALRFPPQVHGLFRFTAHDGCSPCSFTMRMLFLCPVIASCNGLLLHVLSNSKLCVVNPTTGKYKVVPDPKTASLPYGKWHLGLAYDPVNLGSVEYRIVYVYVAAVVAGEDVCAFEIFDSAANSWRKSKTMLRCSSKGAYFKGQAVYLNGALHWVRDCVEIVAFDVEKEYATLIDLPSPLADRRVGYFSWFGAVKGLIYLVGATGDEIRTWVLHDYGKRRWGFVTNFIGFGGMSGGLVSIVFFDDELLLVECNKVILMYNMKQEKWSVGLDWLKASGMGTTGVFIPFVPALAPISGSSSSDADFIGSLVQQLSDNTVSTTREARGRKRKAES